MKNWKAYLREHLQLPGMRKHRDQRILDELSDHLEDLYLEALSRGLSQEEARSFVLSEFGEMEIAAKELVETEPAHLRATIHRWVDDREDGLRTRGLPWHFLSGGLRDLRMASRSLARQPMFAIVVIVVLAVGIGSTTAIFTLLDAIALSPLDFEESDLLVSIRHTAPSRGLEDAGQCAAWHLTYEDENQIFEDIGIYSGGQVAVTGVGDPESAPALFASSGVFRALKLEPVLGRTLTPGDEQPGAPSELLLGHAYWQTRFGGDSSVLGEIVEVDGESWEIVGVMPPLLSQLEVDHALILPFRFDRSTLFVGNIGFDAVARLRDGVTLDQATADLSRILPMAWEKFPRGPVSSSNDPSAYQPIVEPLKDRLVGSVAQLLWILQGGVLVVLLIACANVANLLLVRAEGRGTEIAVRSALGASRYRIGWEYLSESLLLAGLGGIGGLALAFTILGALTTWGLAELPRIEQVSLNWPVLAFTLGLSVFTGLCFGMIPAIRSRPSSLLSSLQQGGSRGMAGRGRNRLQNGLAVVQISMALLLLVGSGLMLRSARSMATVDPGFDLEDDLMALRLTIPSREIPDLEKTAATFERIARRLEEIPGVDAVALASRIPLDRTINYNPFHAQDATPRDAPPPAREHNWIGEGYFETLGIRLLAGRTFSWSDIHNRFPGAIVSESLAREYWGSPEAALGKSVSARPTPVRWHEVIGVVQDVRYASLDEGPAPIVYWPQVTLAFWDGTALEQPQTWRSMGFAIKSDRVGTPEFLPEVRNAIWSVKDNLPVLNAIPIRELAARSIARTTFTLLLMGLAASVALLLGVIGVYGVISYAVTQRTRELGLRMVLGADAAGVKKMVLRQGLLLAIGGVALGIVFSLGLTRTLSGLLFGVTPTDPLTYLVVAGGLVVATLVASYLPARRAARVDPIHALRSG